MPNKLLDFHKPSIKLQQMHLNLLREKLNNVLSNIHKKTKKEEI
jgi:hypothetical protein